MTVVVRCSSALRGCAQAMAPAIREIDPRATVGSPVSMTARLARVTATLNVYVLAVVGAALMALGMAAVGIGGLLAFDTQSRLPEIGLRMAVGASRGDIFCSVMRRGMLLVGAGLIVGCTLGVALGKLAQSVWSGVGQPGVALPIVASAVVAAASALACAAPAWWATRTELTTLMRSQ